MANKNPIKYDDIKHKPFDPGDVLIPNVLNLLANVQAGDGISITALPGGRIRIDNTCCVDPCVPDWQPTGQTICADGTTRNEEADGCGNTRWIDTGVACGGCTPNWQDTGVTRCTGGNVENQQLDGCGNSRWFDTGTPVAWTNNGATVCGGGGTLLQPQINQCGNTRLHDTGVACVDPCTPVWADTGTTRCTGANVESYQEDGCGNSRWHDTGVPVAWTDNGGRQCAGGFYQRNETNQCGATRWANIEPVAWTNTGTQRCTGTYVENQQINQCGVLQWVSTGVLVSWGDTGVYDCSGANLMAEQINQCGTTRMDNRGPMPWTNTGAPTCVDGTLRQLQTNPCGGTRTVDTGTACGAAFSPQLVRAQQALPGATSVTARYEVRTTGDAYKVGPPITTLLEHWLVSGAAGDFEIRMTHVSGTSFAGEPLNTWLPVTAARQWRLSHGGSEGTTQGVGLIECRFASTHVVVSSAEITIQAVLVDNN